MYIPFVCHRCKSFDVLERVSTKSIRKPMIDTLQKMFDIHSIEVDIETNCIYVVVAQSVVRWTADTGVAGSKPGRGNFLWFIYLDFFLRLFSHL